MQMRLKSIAITNMAGFAKFSADLPAIALVQGGNEQGKTSFLDCIKYCFGRGHDPAMIHGTADFGEVLVTFDTGAQVKARAVRESNTTTRSYKAPGATRFLVGRAEIDAMTNAVSYDALEFMRLEPKGQVETLLRVMPMEVKPEELKAALGEMAGLVEVQPAGTSGMVVVDAAHKNIYDQRREVNGQADLQAKHAVALESALPPPAPEGTDWEAETKRLRAEVARIDTQESTALAQLRTELDATKETANQAYRVAVAKIDEDINAEIRELERKRTARTEGAADDEKTVVGAARKTANEAAATAGESCKPRRDRATAELATATERARAQQQATGTRLAVEKARAEVAVLKSKSDAMTAALDRLQALKETVAARIPLNGITFPNGLLADAKGVPFARWNDATKMTFCLKLAVLAHGEAGFICLDGAQQFDPEHRKALYTAAKKYADEKGLQFVIATVTQGPLQITQPKPGSECTWCAEGMPVADGQHETLSGPIPCLEKG